MEMKNMLKTGYFWKATHEPEPDVQYVSISRQKQRGAEHIPTYEALMPSWDIIKLAHDSNYSEESFAEYRKLYYQQLDKLDPAKIYSDLQNCTVICFESPKDLANGKKYCHRRMFAGWIEEKLGIVVPEDVREKEKQLVVPAVFRN